MIALKKTATALGLFFSFLVQSRAGDAGFFEPLQPPRRVQVIAHHGESLQAPPHSRAALVRCLEDGLEWASVAVRRTRDGQHVLWGDDSVPAGSGQVWRVAEHTVAELQTLDIGSAMAARYRQERILTFKDGLALAAGRLDLHLECEDVNVEQFVREIREAKMERQVLVCGSLAEMVKIRSVAAGQLAVMAKWSPALGAPAWAATNGLTAVEASVVDLSPEVCAAFQREHVMVLASAVGGQDNQISWARGIAAGANWIETAFPQELVAFSLWQRVKTRPVLFSLHRGANRYAPENTLPAFEEAIRLGADFVEFDVRTTSDGKYYLLHDSVFEGKTDGKGAIADTPASVVSRISAGVRFGAAYAKVGLPTLDEFMADVAGKVNLYFDAKAIPADVLAAALKKYDVLDRTVVYGGDTFLARVKAADPRIRLLPSLDSVDDLDRLARELHPYAVDASWDILSAAMIARCHALGIKVFSDALGKHETIADYLKAMDWGIDLIQTDHPLRVMRAIEIRSLKPVAGSE